MTARAIDPAAFMQRQIGYLPGELGIEIIEVKPGYVKSRLPVSKRLMAPNGFLHAASVIALADTSAGYGCIASLSEGARGFTTIELKMNFLGTVIEGVIECEARAVHLGKTTQVWDAIVTDGKGKTLALFRCTQMVLR
jgi:1,4-dihydroxy-2-naphthoyl-CoA hydrolase